MPRELFEDVSNPPAEIGSRARFTLPVSIGIHAAVVAGVLAAPPMAPSFLAGAALCFHLRGTGAAASATAASWRANKTGTNREQRRESRRCADTSAVNDRGRTPRAAERPAGGGGRRRC